MKLLKLVLVSVFLLGNVLAYAQEAAFGLKAGLNLTALKLDDPEASYDSRSGFHAGLFLRGKFNKVAIQPEVLLFTQAGTRTTSISTIEESFTYLSIPMIVKFYPALGFNIQVGPQFGFLLDGEKKVESFGVITKRDITESYKESDVSVSVGLGYDFDFGLNMDARYNIGVKDINNEASGEPAKSRIFLISLGWNFLK
jgi:outer membrane protein with beta-barrel domain